MRPKLDFASEMIGIVGATTNNNTGMAGIDRSALLQSYSVLRDARSGDDEDNIISLTVEDGTTREFYLDLLKFGDLVQRGRANGVDVHLFSFGVPTGKLAHYEFGRIPSAQDYRPFSFPKPPEAGNWPFRLNLKLTVAARLDQLLTVACGLGEAAGISECPVPPDALKIFRERVGFAAAEGGKIVVAPAGDKQEAVNEPEVLGCLPGMLDKYVTAVGGITENANDQIVKWERTLERPYVDVAAFAEDVVGLSGDGPDQYNTSFGGTAAAAPIGAGVASLLLEEDPSPLSSEDIDEILEITAYDVADPGQDNATGAGAIDAGAALAFVRNNDVQRARRTVTDVYYDEVVEEDVKLYGSGYKQYAPKPACRTVSVVWADLHEFRARIDFANTFSSPPEAWVRWGQSEGIDSQRDFDGNGDVAAYYDPLTKRLEVISVDETGIDVRGYYWNADFHNGYNECARGVDLPDSPEDFQIAYTAIGTEGDPPAPPVRANLSGSVTLSQDQTGYWNSDATGGEGGSYEYQWYRRNDGWSNWIEVGYNSSSYSHAWHQPGDHDIKVTVTRGGESDSDQLSVHVIDGGGGGCGPTTAGGESSGGSAGNDAGLDAPRPCLMGEGGAALPEAFALEGSYPNPARSGAQIRYALPKAAHVELAVYDALGREVAHLVDRERPAGYHRATFDASELPSGVYVYRLRAGEVFAESGKLVVVK